MNKNALWWSLLLSCIIVALFLSGCPKPPPDPVFPTNVDASIIDAPPANCGDFTGVYTAVDKPVAGSPLCSRVTKNIIHVEVPGEPDPDSNQWDLVIFNEAGQQMTGVAKQVEGRTYICRFVADYEGDVNEVTVINRDFYLSNPKDVGTGESITKNKDCLWQSTSVLTPMQ